MATTQLTAHTFEQTVLDNDTVFVDFWADWCGPCKRFAPVYDEVSEQHSEVVFAKVDTEAEQALAAQINITSIPTLMAFREGILVFRQAGALPKEQFAQLVEKVGKLDMDDVRAQVAQAKAEADSPSASAARPV
ncbi:thioredoxin [Lapillicoccus sp.]|uniref:thioredoxin n=1 Tax=Lapillicoccus sp. TaxID=1909287 RepID=UPI0027C09F58|nr:thioredoxin [Actinomycetota bacterium]